MSIITRYILKEHIGPFLFGLLTIIFVFILNIVFRDLGRLLGKGLSLGVILEFFVYNLAWIVALAVPMAVLIATLMSFGRLSSDNEIAALKSCGVDLYRLLIPVIFAAFALAVGLERFNNCVLPDFNLQVRLLYRDISKKKPTLTLEPHVFFNEIENLSILVQVVDNEKNQIEGIFITDRRESDKPKTIVAEQGTLEFDKLREMMVLTLHNGEVHELEKDLEEYRRMRFERHVLYVEVNNMVLKRSESEHRSEREKSASMMRKDVDNNWDAVCERKEQITQFIRRDMIRLFPSRYVIDSTVAAEEREHLLVLSSDRTRLSGKRIEMNVQQVQNEIRVLDGYQSSIDALTVEIHKKYSIPIACIVFVLIGAPLGIMARQGGLAVGGGLSLVFFLVYWAFLIGGEQLADRRLLNPIFAMWAPNILVGIGGIYLIIHTIHETTVIRWDHLALWMKKITGGRWG